MDRSRQTSPVAKSAGLEGLVSVVIPSYNVGPHLPRAVDSVLAQSLRPLEIIVVDDSSTDGSFEAASQYGPPVRVIRQGHSGVSAARNAAIRQSRGEFIAFLDGDDEWMPRHLENASKVFERFPNLRWTCATYKRKTKSRTLCTRSLMGCDFRGYMQVDDFFKAQAAKAFCWINTVVVRRDVFDEVGLFDESMEFAEDIDLWIRIALRYPQVGYCGQLAAIWWARDGSLSHLNPKTAEILLQSARRYTEMTRAMGPAAQKLCRPLVRSWLTNAALQAARNGQPHVLRSIGTEFDNVVGPGMAALCRLAPASLLGAVAAIKNRLKKLRRGM